MSRRYYKKWKIHKINHYEEFRKFHRYLIWLRPLALVVPILLIYLMFKFIGIKALTIFFAVILTAKEIVHLIIMLRLEKRIIKPIEKLKAGVEEIAKGNYNIRIQSSVFNEIGMLIDEFNKMAEKLNENEKMKQVYEENRKDLIANISHDLKTPITSINGYIETLIDGVITSPEKVNSYLRIIENNMTYMNNLIDDLFLFSKLDMQKLEFKFEKIDLVPFVTDMMEEFKFMLGEQGIILKLNNNITESLMVNIDTKRIYQAIRNVIGNAVKYANSEKLIIAVTIYSENNLIKIDIADNGPGIPQDKLPY
ncbi:MAG: HAMP domain-containing sensor histidine kinase, partial [Bacillota bacterium]|nr:HAMP domain-containing sensor histidine kinase [Bacillota bacterium]